MLSSEVGRGFTLTVVDMGTKGVFDLYDIVLFRNGSYAVSISKGCVGEKSAEYHFNVCFNQLKKIMIMADTVDDTLGTADEKFFKEWLNELIQFWGTEAIIYKYLRKTFADYLV